MLSSIIDNTDKLSFNWHPGCLHLGGDRYSSGEIGMRGPGVTNEMIAKIKREWVKPKLPSTLVFYINFNNTATPELFNKIVEELKLLKALEGSEGEISIEVTPMRKVVETKLRDEYFEENRKKEEEQKIKDAKINALLNQLGDLNYEVTDFEKDAFVTPNEWKEVTREYLDPKYARINVSCHFGTRFYKILHNEGILDSAYPEWYAKGKF